MEVRECLDELKYQLKIKTDSALAEYLGVSPSALTKWLSRNELPSKWQIKINNMLSAKDKGVLVVENNGHISVNTSTFNHSAEVKDIIELLKYAPPGYLEIVKAKLEEFKKFSEE